MSTETGKRSQTILLMLLLAYGAASLVHYVHNARFLTDYPNMPHWLSAQTTMSPHPETIAGSAACVDRRFSAASITSRGFMGYPSEPWTTTRA
jgi:hypothetical protein